MDLLTIRCLRLTFVSVPAHHYPLLVRSSADDPPGRSALSLGFMVQQSQDHHSHVVV